MAGAPRQNTSIDVIIEKFVIEDVHTECWNWQGAKHVQGYNMVRYDGKMHRAERLIKQEIEGHNLGRKDRVSNTCNNNNCVNPNHHTIKWEGTYDNPYGQRPSKFSKEEYEAIMKEYYSEPEYRGKDAKICKKYDINPNMMVRMKRGQYRPTR